MTGRDVPYWALQDLAKRLGLNPATLEELTGYR
jgi:DNA uptake protein ComE-like DNA-binding protein